jgi:hypothetical protein
MQSTDLQDGRARGVTVGPESHTPKSSAGATARVLTYATAAPAGTTALRVAVTLLIVVGAVLAVYSGAVHIKLWNDGYGTIPTIGPLFLFQGIVGVLLGLVLVASRRLVVVVATAGFMVATIGGLLISVHIGLFGFVDTFAAPYASLSLAAESAGALVLVVAGVLVGWGARSALLPERGSGAGR